MVTAEHPPMLGNLPFYRSRGSPGLPDSRRAKKAAKYDVCFYEFFDRAHNVRQEESPVAMPETTRQVAGHGIIASVAPLTMAPTAWRVSTLSREA
jgi:hypothetical protein